MIVRCAALGVLACAAALSGSAALAQTAAAQPGITVTAFGSAAATADAVQLVLRGAPRNGLASISANDVKALADAFVRAGVDPATMTDPFPAQGPWATVSVSGMLKDPSPRSLQSALDELARAAQSLPSLVMQQLTATLTLNDCRAIFSQARRIAASQARAQALDVVAASGGRLGRPVSITMTPGAIGGPPGRTPNSCTSSYIIGGGNPPFSNLTQMFQVRVYSTLTITYAIR